LVQPAGSLSPITVPAGIIASEVRSSLIAIGSPPDWGDVVFAYGTIALCGATFQSLRLTHDFVTSRPAGPYIYYIAFVHPNHNHTATCIHAAKVHLVVWAAMAGACDWIPNACARALNSLVVGFWVPVQMSITCCSDFPILLPISAYERPDRSFAAARAEHWGLGAIIFVKG
jgi:hypothetical protein